MKILKRTTAILFIFLFIVTPVCINTACKAPVYAVDEWEDVTKADLVTAFKYYCKSRNLAVEGSLADALTTFTTDTFNNLVNTLGIDSDAIQAELKKTTQGNLGLRFLFTQTGVNFYNRIFAEFLQNNDLSVGDTVDDKVLYSGKSYNGSLLYVFPNNNGSTANAITVSNSYITSFGSTYGLSYSQIISATKGNPVIFTSSINGHDIELRGALNDSYYGNYWGYVVVDGKSANRNVVGGYNSTHTSFYPGHGCLAYSTTRGQLFVGYAYGTNESLFLNSTPISDAEPTDVKDTDIYVTTNNNTINNNDYSKDYTIIYNDGDYYDIDHNYPSPDTPPDGGGGGGGDNPDTPTPPSPPSSTPPDWPIELPDTDIDWIIRGMEERFPWDIPFNVMFALSLLNAEPETPHFEGTIDLKVVQWDYDIDLEPFDQIAEYFRKFFFFSFLVWLLLVTKKLIWG